MTPVKVLIVEDEAIIAHNLARILKKLGYQVVKAVMSGEDALQALSETQPDVILMDIVLQGAMNGMQAGAEIMKLFDIPIIYVTAYTDDQILQQIRHVGGYGFVVKPYKKQQLHASIQLALGQHQRVLESQAPLHSRRARFLLSSQAIAALGQQLFSSTHSSFLVISTLIIRMTSDIGQLSNIFGEQCREGNLLMPMLTPFLRAQDVAGWLTQTDLMFLSYMRTPDESVQWANTLKVQVHRQIQREFGHTMELESGFAYSVHEDLHLDMVFKRAYDNMLAIVDSRALPQGL